MTTDERLAALITLHEDTQKSLKTLMDSISRYIDSANAFMQSSNARTAQLEANLDALIRAITREHGNGKGKK